MSMIIWPDLKTLTVPVDCEIAMATASVDAVIAAAAACRVPRPLERLANWDLDMS